MYAVIRSGGKQYRVGKGERVMLDKMLADKGATVQFDEVLAVRTDDGLELGSPLLPSAKVTARVLRHGRGRKIVVFRSKRRKGYRRKKGHRQDFTEVQIEDIAAK
jgi:large subunit ribosomal protein L21